MAKLIALDTSTDACSVALWLDGEVVEDFRVVPRQHTKLLLPMVEALLAAHQLTVNDLDAVVVGRGPGSFTGIRIATGVAQGIAFAADLPVAPVSTLAALAEQARVELGAESVVSLLDARMDEIYAAAFEVESESLVEVLAEAVLPPTELTLPALSGRCVGVGAGWHYFPDGQFSEQLTVHDTIVHPSAGAMVRLGAQAFAAGKVVSADQCTPLYLRDEVAWKKKDQQ